MDDFTLPGGGGGGAGTNGTNEPIALTSNYNKLSESIRRHAPPQLQCSVFCGGRRCKYESPNYWSSEKCTINGIFSTWSVHTYIFKICSVFLILGGIKLIIN